MIELFMFTVNELFMITVDQLLIFTVKIVESKEHNTKKIYYISNLVNNRGTKRNESTSAKKRDCFLDFLLSILLLQN